MKINELLDKYTILAPIRNKKTQGYLCLNNKNLCYAYFEKQKDQFYENEREVLKLLGTSSAYKLIKVDERMNANLQQNIIPPLNDAINGIVEYFSSLDTSFRKIILSKLEKSVLIDANALNSGLKYGRVPAFFYPKENQIVFTEYSFDSNTDTLSRYITHELLHCFSNNMQTQRNGFLQYIMDDTNLMALCGYYGLNEVITEYFCNKILTKREQKEMVQCGYDLCRFALTPLLNLLDEKKLARYYLNSDFDGFVEYFAKEFYVSNTANVIRLFHLIDLCMLDVEKLQTKVATQCYEELFASAFDLLLNKLNIEGKDISKIPFMSMVNFDPVYDKYVVYNRIKNSGYLYRYFESAKLCLAHFNKCLKNNFDYPQQICQEDFLMIIKSLHLNLPLKQDEKLEYLKTFETYSFLLLDGQRYMDPVTFKAQSFDAEKIFRTLLNPENNYLPKNNAHAKKIIEKFLLSQDVFNADLIGCVDEKLLIKLCNDNEEVLNQAIAHHQILIFKHIKELSQKSLCNKSLYWAVMKSCSTMDIDRAMGLVYAYYTAFDVKNRTRTGFQTGFLSDFKKNLPYGNEENFRRMYNLLVRDKNEFDAEQYAKLR